MPSPRHWLAAARPRTLPAAVAPVLVGSGAAAGINQFHLGRALLAAGVALALQIGVNFANDYSDGIRGTDAQRIGPQRLTASGEVQPRTVRNAAFAAFATAGVFGLLLTVVTGLWWLLAVGAAAVVAAWFYTGGKRPYGYAGFGEVFVFLFFGLVATLGTMYVQARMLTLAAVLGAVGVGLLACAIMLVNNIRDIPGDQLARKNTLAVRIGGHAARRVYVGLLAAALLLGLVIALITTPWAWFLAVLALPAWFLARPVLHDDDGAALIPVLGGTAKLELFYAAIIAVALALSA
ncbi:MAG: 1,4-dihydroxy-2-naphthoate polyprenyltransferase [Promicromonosporaceae bacterium]|nr:1,4-dihydroxy-2-naphthoate polyprenyltransferase [Promicromonosporaceae bacterium]